MWLTATNQTQGAELRVFLPSNDSQAAPSYRLREVKGHFLSPECGELFEKCKPLLVVVNQTNTRFSKAVVLVPLSNAMALWGLDFTSSGLTDKVHVVGHNYDCSPRSVHRIRDGFYTICSNSETGFVNLLELKLNATHLEKSYFSNLEHPHMNSVANLTNSVYIELPSMSGDRIFFASGDSIFYFQPLDYLMGELEVNLEDVGCFVTELGYIGEWEMIVYCANNRAEYVDLKTETITLRAEFGKDGRPYVCPNPDMYLGVHVSDEYIEYGLFSAEYANTIDVPMSSFDDGVCLGTENVTVFIVSDGERGTLLVNVSSSYIESLSRWPCTNYPCQPLVVLDSRYLVLREQREGDWHISVFDSHNNFSHLHSIPHVRADTLGYFNTCVPPPNNSSSVFSTTPTPTPTPTPVYSSKTKVKLVAILLPVFIVLFLAVVGAVIGGIAYYCYVRVVKREKVMTGGVGFEQRRRVEDQMVAGAVKEGMWVLLSYSKFYSEIFRFRTQ